jgi:polyferredoxin
MFRPRVLIYTSVLIVIVSIFFGALLTRLPVKMDVIRDRGSMGREIENGMIENVYRLQLMNTDESVHHYRISVSGIDSIQLRGLAEFTLNGIESRAVAVDVRADQARGQKGSNKIWFTLVDIDNPDILVKEKAVFFVPR